MLMFLANNSRTDISYAVHQCARFTHLQKSAYGSSVKRIICYIQGIKCKRLIISPRKTLQVEFHVDDDFPEF